MNVGIYKRDMKGLYSGVHRESNGIDLNDMLLSQPLVTAS